MASDPRFLEAWVNRSDHKVLGRRLHPLCLLDILALDAVDSPFLFSDREATESDFVLAVLLLSREHKTLEINADLPKPSLRDRLRIRCCDLKEENAKLCAYFEDYWSTLEMWEPKADGEKPPCNAPWILGNVTFLLNHTTLSEWRIWTAPIGQILCYANSLEEQLGGRGVVSEDERTRMQELREQQKAEAAHGN